jgi:hypothetical protein
MRGAFPHRHKQPRPPDLKPMKIAIATIALIAAIPLALLADKDKDVKVQVPDKSGVSVEDITPATPIFTFKLKNGNSYAVHVSGRYVIPYSFHNFEEDLKANESKLMTGGLGKGKILTEIIVDKVEKMEKKN